MSAKQDWHKIEVVDCWGETNGYACPFALEEYQACYLSRDRKGLTRVITNECRINNRVPKWCKLRRRDVTITLNFNSKAVNWLKPVFTSSVAEHHRTMARLGVSVVHEMDDATARRVEREAKRRDAVLYGKKDKP